MFFLFSELIPFLFLPYWYSNEWLTIWCVSAEPPTWSNARAHPLHVLSPCGVFHLSPPIPSSFQHCCSVLQHCTLPTASFLRRSLEAMWMSHSANTPPADFLLCTLHCTPGKGQSSAKVQYQRSFWAIPASAANAVQGLAQQCSANQWNARFRWQSLQCKLFESDTLQSILALSANGSSFQMDHLLQSEAIASNQPAGP